MADPKIPLADLPYGLPGAFDRVAGVDTATGAAKQFPMPQAGEPKDYPTRASLPSAAGLPDGTAAHVNNDPNPDNNGRWAVFGGQWVQSADRVSGLEGRTSALELDVIPLVTGKNLLDKSQIRAGYTVSVTHGNVVTSSVYRLSGFIPVEAGKTYRVSGRKEGMAGGWFSAPQDNAGLQYLTAAQLLGPVVAPAGATHLVLNISNDGPSNPTFDDTSQVEEGTEATRYEPFIRGLPQAAVLGLPEAIESKLERDDVLEDYSFNMLDPGAVDYVFRYSRASLGFTTDTIGVAASGYIPVREGEWYTVSGAGMFRPTAASMQGGYFAEAGAATAVADMAFVEPVGGGGAAFQVPTGLGITHAVISLKKAGEDPDSTTLEGPVQVERGEMATAYRPHAAHPRVKPELLSGDAPAPQPGEGFNAAAWLKYTEGDSGDYLGDKIPVFRKHWLLRDKDLCVVNTGTSLTARSVEHCTDHPQAALRPPLMHSRNMASIVWDKMAWDGQQYRRYDNGIFTETGAFQTSSSLPEWDDGPYRSGLTRYLDGAASVAFSVPEGAWQFNFIYRTDSVGSEACTLSVAGGNGLMQVQNPSGAWVEANGYVFSMREPAPVARSIVVPLPETGGSTTVTIPSKGNTTYQKRLKMRCRGTGFDSRSEAKAVNISSPSGRFMYWGVEWSPREWMLTYINAARGSHHTRATAERGLPRYQDNEIWIFKPDLLFFELPIHNDGAAAAASHPTGYWKRLTDNFVFRDDYELSLRARGAHFGLEPEIGMFTSSIAWNFGGIEDDGSLKFGEESGGGRMMTALDKFTEAAQWVWENHPEVVCINAAKRWCDAAVAIFGDLRSATEGSGKAGATFTNEGSHWNDTGSKIIAKALTPVFEFVR